MDTPSKLLSLADRCVKCGLCLPQCPTYTLTSSENESPRGRIALIQGWLEGQLSPSEKLKNHLDQCLLCRRCERVCPSLVPYGEIMDGARSLYSEKVNETFTPASKTEQFSLKLLTSKYWAQPVITSLRLFQKTGLLKLAERSGIAKLLGTQRLLSFLPELEKPLKTDEYYPAKIPGSKNVALFTGCLSTKLDTQTVKDSISLLNQLGFNVCVPPQQVCCGSLDLHEGNKSQMLEYAAQNASVFNRLNITTIISLVNGCSVQLKEYKKLSDENQFVAEVKDIIEFLADIEWPQKVSFQPSEQAFALHIPCTLQNSLRAEDKLLALLKKIPGINLPPEAINNSCCGAAGSYFLRHPVFSEQLQAKALNKLQQPAIKTIISSNIGCTLQLKAGVNQQNDNVDIIHPVTLLVKQLNIE